MLAIVLVIPESDACASQAVHLRPVLGSLRAVASEEIASFSGKSGTRLHPVEAPVEGLPQESPKVMKALKA